LVEEFPGGWDIDGLFVREGRLGTRVTEGLIGDGRGDGRRQAPQRRERGKERNEQHYSEVGRVGISQGRFVAPAQQQPYTEDDDGRYPEDEKTSEQGERSAEQHRWKSYA
jgi:hypothetical protein